MPVPQFTPYVGAYRDACLALFDQHCPEFFAPNERDDYASFLDASPPGYLVVVDDGHVVAAFGVIDGGEPGRRRINWILVARDAQGSGVGRRMMAEVRERAIAAGAHVVDIAASQKSAPFFEKFGAHAVTQTPDGWGPGMHRVDMEWRLE